VCSARVTNISKEKRLKKFVSNRGAWQDKIVCLCTLIVKSQFKPLRSCSPWSMIVKLQFQPLKEKTFRGAG
jgi:hypothetical protein